MAGVADTAPAMLLAKAAILSWRSRYHLMDKSLAGSSLDNEWVLVTFLAKRRRAKGQ
jgi:hypothetical protein